MRSPTTKASPRAKPARSPLKTRADKASPLTARVKLAVVPPKARDADLAYDRIEQLIAKLELQPGAPVVEAELADMVQLGRTPVREALMRMVSAGLIVQNPRRGLVVSAIDVVEHLDVIETRRVLERLIAAHSARRANDAQRKALVAKAQKMLKAAERGQLDDYMLADQELDHVNFDACGNRSAVNAVLPLIVKCRRFWYAYQHEGDVIAGAHAHLHMAQAIAQGDADGAKAGADGLMDYLVAFTRRVIDS